MRLPLLTLLAISLTVRLRKSKKRKLDNKTRAAKRLKTDVEPEVPSPVAEAQDDYLDPSIFVNASKELKKAKKLRAAELASEIQVEERRERKVRDQGPTEGSSVQVGSVHPFSSIQHASEDKIDEQQSSISLLHHQVQ